MGKTEVSDIELWSRERRGGDCQICKLPEDFLHNLTIGWERLGYRERQLYQYCVDRGHGDDPGVSRHFIRRHFKENHGRSNG